MPRAFRTLDAATHLAGLRRGMMFVGCTAAICAVLAAGAEGRSAKAGQAADSARVGQP